MSTDGDGAAGRLDGLALEAAVERVVADNPDRDPERVRAALDHVTEDGAVREAAVEDALAHAAKVVSTPETRVELASMALTEARDGAAQVDDLDVVAARLDEFAERLTALEDRLDALRETFGTAVESDGSPDSLYATASAIEETTREANAVQRAADELAAEIEEFQRWLDDPEVRYDRLAGDLDAAADTLDELADTADALAGARDDDELTTPRGSLDPGVAWFDAAVRGRTVALLLADLRTEVAALRTWADREGVDDAPLDDLADRCDALDERRDALAARLDDLARAAWADRFGETLDALDDRFERLEPPVDWDEAEAALDRHRTAVE